LAGQTINVVVKLFEPIELKLLKLRGMYVENNKSRYEKETTKT